MKRKAVEAKRLADAKNAELDALYRQWHSTPEKIERINQRLSPIADQLTALDPAKLAEDFKATFRLIQDGGLTDPFGLVFVAATIVTRDLRAEVLTGLTEELQGELAQLKAKQKALARKLGQRI